jgi:hypothetical protein
VEPAFCSDVDWTFSAGTTIVPFGVWALSVLTRRDVKEAFAANIRDEGMRNINPRIVPKLVRGDTHRKRTEILGRVLRTEKRSQNRPEQRRLPMWLPVAPRLGAIVARRL